MEPALQIAAEMLTPNTIDLTVQSPALMSFTLQS
jgi:hypothetical protein